MAMVYRRMGDWEMSQSYIYKVIAFNPKDPLYLTNIGLSFTYLHKYDSALIYHQKAIAENPGWAASYLNKIETLVLKYGNTSEARAELDSLTGHTNGKQMEIKILLDIYDGKYNDAFSEADKTGPEDYNIKGNQYLYLARISSLLNNPINAGKYYEAALAVLDIDISNDSTDAGIHSLIGIANAGKGNKDKAIAEGKKAIELAVMNKMEESDMILNLAKIYTMLGLYDEALANIEYSLKNPSLLSAKLLLIDPIWKPLLKNQKFETMIRKYSNK
jgi:tetratricopeptide (TPR) repeat protein